MKEKHHEYEISVMAKIFMMNLESDLDTIRQHRRRPLNDNKILAALRGV
jgi:hypothetical protein